MKREERGGSLWRPRSGGGYIPEVRQSTCWW